MPPTLRNRATLERELGSSGTAQRGGLYWSDVEETPELQFPQSIMVYDRMRRTDAQVAAVIRAMSLPIRSARWTLMGSDVRPEVMELVRHELGLVPDDKGRRTRDLSGVVWADFLRHALLHVPLGFMAFEQVYKVGPPGPGLEELPGMAGREIAHIRKLGPRLPRQVSGIDVARDGGLEGIRQNVRRDDGFGYEEVKIPTDRLVMFVNDQEGAEWTGNGILRASYKHWLIAEGLERLGGLIVERNGMGLVVCHYPRNGDRNLALAIARSARAGEDAGVALPDGYKLEIMGVQGSLKDELPLIKFHKEQVGKNALTMLLDLGHDAGARSLGDTFLTFLLMALDSIADYIGEVVTRHVIADLVALNFGVGETYPVLKAEDIEPKSPATSQSLKELVEAGILIPTGEDEVHERRRRGMPIPPGLPTEPESAPVDRIDDVPVEDDPDAPPEPPAEEPGDEPGPDEVLVKPHKRKRPGAAQPTEALERRLATVKRRLEVLRKREDRRDGSD